MSEENEIPPEEIPQEQPANKDSSDEIISSAEPVTEAEQPQTTNLSSEALPAGQAGLAKEDDQPQTEEDMEVHHHTHPAHGKKTWKAYFWEFLMLFLAVFCGFLAEYKLEHMIEHQREKQYIQSLIADLKSDQQVLAQHILHIKSGISMMDTVSTILNTPLEIANNTGHLYYLARLAPRLNPLSNNTRTFEQLKNSGNFRLIRNISTSNKVMAYYEKFPLIRLLESVNEAEFNEYKKVAAKIFDPAVFIKMEGNNGTIVRISNNPSLRTTDPELLQELSIFSVYMNGTKKGILGADEELKIAAADLIEYLQKEYHLE